MMKNSQPQSKLISALALVGLVTLVLSYFVPVWWVSLTAPNYPSDAFPDGIRIHFMMSEVTNGCTTPPETSRLAQETMQEDIGWRDEEGNRPSHDDEGEGALDCVHEMNTINHYVGMQKIAFGAPVELSLSRYILGVFAVMLIGFAVGPIRQRTLVLSGGFAAVTIWMVTDMFVFGRMGSILEGLKSAVKGPHFSNPDDIAAWAQSVQTFMIIVMAVLVAAMVFSVWANIRWPKFQLALGIIPALMPVFFLASYGGWLYYFGHNLHEMGAFTVKPFMPTIFGDGKVAQFTTHSYPHIGFFLILATTLVMIVAVARRRLELTDESESTAPARRPREATAH